MTLLTLSPVSASFRGFVPHYELVPISLHLSLTVNQVRKREREGGVLKVISRRYVHKWKYDNHEGERHFQWLPIFLLNYKEFPSPDK